MTAEGAILAILAEEAGAAAVLRHAAEAANALPGAIITALHVKVDPISTIMPTEEILSDEQARAIETEGEREGAALHAVFEAWRPTVDMPPVWRDVRGTVDAQVREHARAASLVVLAAPRPNSRGHALTALHTALFDTGRPVLVVPVAHDATPVRCVVVGWKDSDVARRAMEAAASWLRMAAVVHVVHVGDSADELATAEQVLAGLGITATVKAVSSGGLDEGARLLAEAEALGADLVVMGAYRHNRLTEWILGGVTRTVLSSSKVPLFLVH